MGILYPTSLLLLPVRQRPDNRMNKCGEMSSEIDGIERIVESRVLGSSKTAEKRELDWFLLIVFQVLRWYDAR